MPKNNSPKEVTLAINRRRFIYYSAIAATSAALTGSVSGAPRRIKSANDKLNIGCIGVGGKGASDVDGAAAGNNIVALCDVDETTLNKTAKKYSGATLYRDYRKMLEQHKDLDAVVISTPDHQHFLPAMMAIQRGKHVYCHAHDLGSARTRQGDEEIQSRNANGKPGPRARRQSAVVRNHLERRDWRH